MCGFVGLLVVGDASWAQDWDIQVTSMGGAAIGFVVGLFMWDH